MTPCDRVLAAFSSFETCSSRLTAEILGVPQTEFTFATFSPRETRRAVRGGSKPAAGSIRPFDRVCEFALSTSI